MKNSKNLLKMRKNNTKIFDFLKFCGYNCKTKLNKKEREC